MEIDSARINALSEKEVTVSKRKADSIITGRMNSSEVIVKRKMTPKTAKILYPSSVQTMPDVRGYSSS